MRPEWWTSRTVVLAAIAGWSLLVTVLTWFGLGGHIVPLKDDPRLVAVLPQLPARPAERLGLATQYTAMTQRPLFYPSRTPQPFYLSGEEESGNPGFDYVLSSVMITPRLRLAILQPSQGGEGIRVKEGESLSPNPQWRLVELAERSAVFEGPEGRRSLELRVFDGNGGPPPTAAAAAAAAPALSGPGMVPPASRNTGGNAAPTVVAPAPVADPLPSSAPAPAASVPAQTSAEQMDAIRKRIEERRRRLREQQGNPAPASTDKTQ